MKSKVVEIVGIKALSLLGVSATAGVVGFETGVEWFYYSGVLGSISAVLFGLDNAFGRTSAPGADEGAGVGLLAMLDDEDDRTNPGSGIPMSGPTDMHGNPYGWSDDH